MRLYSILLAVVAAGAQCVPRVAAEPAPDSPPEPHLMVSNEGEHFQYSIIHPELVRRAWIEIVDRPTLIDKKVVEILRYGEFDWQWDHTSLNDPEEDDDALKLALWDPDGETIVCEGTTMYRRPGGEVSSQTVGGRSRFAPEPLLDTAEVQVAQDSPDFTFEVTGRDLTPDAALHVFSEKGAKCQDRQVQTEVLDLAHARVTLASECLAIPGILFVSGSAEPQSYEFGNKVWVHVAGLTSPTLRSISPSQVDGFEKADQMSFVLRGKRFTRNSKVVAGYLPTGGPFVTPQEIFDTEYISSTELHAKTNGSYGDGPIYEAVGQDRTSVPNSRALRIWVEGNPSRFELSEPRDAQVVPSSRTTAVITSVSPYPIRLMNEHSPEELKIIIHGENFVPENKAMAAFGNSANNERTLRTEYVSPTTLHAWMPRQYWRKHHIVYHLVVETTDGKQYTAQTASEDDD